MSQNLQPLEQLAGQVKGHNTVAEKYDQKAEENYKAAGIYLIEARERIRGGENKEFQTFSAFFVGGCRLEKTRAYEMIAIAEGRKTLEDIREESGRRRDETRNRQKEASAPERTTDNSLVPQDNPEKTPKKRGRPPKETTPEAALVKEITKRLKGMDMETLQDVLAIITSQVGRRATSNTDSPQPSAASDGRSASTPRPEYQHHGKQRVR